VAITEREGRHRRRERGQQDEQLELDVAGVLHDLPRPDESVDDGTPAAGLRTKYHQFTAIDDGIGIVDVLRNLLPGCGFLKRFDGSATCALSQGLSAGSARSSGIQ
jgi:hypothetical protein